MKRHLFHLVTYSPWPLLVSFSVFNFVVGLVMYFNFYYNYLFLIITGLLGILYYMYVWWRDIIREATFEGVHTIPVQKGLRYGMLLFILSEVMFFFSFFWAFFHSSLAPTIEIGAIWPPIGLHVFNPWDVPLLNTAILLLSGSSITLAHYSLLKNNNKFCLFGFIYTIVLAVIFTTLQFFEYCEAAFVINDGVYGSLFYMLTGFHGFHVFIGTLFIIVCLIRYIKGHFSPKHHFGFEAAIWYWHFVDVVWLFLFVCIYWWGNYYYFISLNK